MKFNITGTRKIIRYRATATLKRPHINQYTASNEGAQNQHGNIILFLKNVEVHLTDTSTIIFFLNPSNCHSKIITL